MDTWALVQAVVRGIVEGLTEFLPVSSTGHLIVLDKALGLTDERAQSFEIFIQLGAILAVVWHYRGKIGRLVRHLPQPSERRFVLNLVIAFLPAAIAGFLFHREIKEFLFNPHVVAAALIVGGIAILLIERYPLRARVTDIDAVGRWDAFNIGLAQTLSLIPGVSRAGATIIGGMVAGLSRTAATEFSFFLAIPTMFAATSYDLIKSFDKLHADDALPFALGFVTAFVTALIVIRVFLTYVSRHTFVPFAWYRIGFGLLVLAYFR